MNHAPTPPIDRKRWRPFARPSEKDLIKWAERTANEVFLDTRAALLTKGETGTRALRTLTDFYGSLNRYPGEVNLGLLRAGAMIGTTTLPLSLIAAGLYVAEFPELCGGAPALLGGHLAHVLVGTGAGGLAALAALITPPSGRAWFTDVGTTQANQARGTRRAEEQFWRTFAARWTEDHELSDLMTGPPAEVVTKLLERLNGSGTGILTACEEMLKVEPACANCAG